MAPPVAFANTVQTVLAGYGAPTVVANKLNTSINATTTTITLTLPGVGARCGIARIRSTNVGATTTLNQVKVSVSDAGGRASTGDFPSTFVAIPQTTATAAGDAIDYFFDIFTDITFTSVAFAVTTGVAAAVFDVEFAGNP